jgi:hypothetical protein
MAGIHTLDFNEITGGGARSPGHRRGAKRRKGPPTVRKAPLLIKALSLVEPGVADDAHASLVALAGRDLGRRPGPWGQWWKREGPALLEREGLERKARDLFARTRNAVAGGHWEEIFSSLSFRVRRTVGPEAVEAHLVKHAALLRRAYRDASAAGVRMDGERCHLSVDWGETGFKLRDFPLVLEAGEWRFDRLPWDWRVVENSERAEAGRTGEAGAARRLGRIRAGSGSARFFRAGFLTIAGLAVLVTAAATSWHVWVPAVGAYLVLLACVSFWPRGSRSGPAARPPAIARRRRAPQAERRGA